MFLMASKRLYPKLKLWISSDADEGVFGDGKWRLLAAIEREGSLRAACESLGVSYRKAWGDLRKTERRIGVKFVERRRGGSDGGSTALTETGRRWLSAYRRFREEIEKVTAKLFDKHIAALSAAAEGWP